MTEDFTMMKATEPGTPMEGYDAERTDNGGLRFSDRCPFPRNGDLHGIIELTLINVRPTRPRLSSQLNSSRSTRGAQTEPTKGPHTMHPRLLTADV